MFLGLSDLGLNSVRQSVDSDAAAWAAAVSANSGTYSSSTLNAVSNFCKAAKSAGYWNKLNRINLFCGDQLAAALVPLKVGAGSATDVNTNFVSGDYTEATGLTGDGSTKSLDTGVPQNTFTAADRHLSVYERVRATATDNFSIGSESPANAQRWGIGIFTPVTSTRYAASSTTAGADQTGLVSGGTGGHFVGTGTDTQASIYLNGGNVVNAAVVAATPNATAQKVFALSVTGTAARFSNATIAGYSIGTGLTSSDVSAFYTHMQEFQTALGRGV